jgi:hypothetical protein
MLVVMALIAYVVGLKLVVMALIAYVVGLKLVVMALIAYVFVNPWPTTIRSRPRRYIYSST